MVEGLVQGLGEGLLGGLVDVSVKGFVEGLVENLVETIGAPKHWTATGQDFCTAIGQVMDSWTNIVQVWIWTFDNFVCLGSKTFHVARWRLYWAIECTNPS